MHYYIYLWSGSGPCNAWVHFTSAQDPHAAHRTTNSAETQSAPLWPLHCSYYCRSSFLYNICSRQSAYSGHFVLSYSGCAESGTNCWRRQKMPMCTHSPGIKNDQWDGSQSRMQTARWSLGRMITHHEGRTLLWESHYSFKAVSCIALQSFWCSRTCSIRYHYVQFLLWD